MTTLRQSYWRLVRKRPLILWWSFWLWLVERWCLRFHRREWTNYDGPFVYCRRCREERCYV